MTNGVRQGLGTSPYLFSIYADELNMQLSEAKLGCFFFGEEALNDFSYADDLALLAPFASALNSLVIICKRFVEENLIHFSAPKSVVMLILSPAYKLRNKPNIYESDT